MLRRKTPNGILAAAYDGTAVEQTDKPHATKHILLPVTAESSIPYALKQELPLRSPSINGEFTHKQDGSSDWSPSLYFETGSGRASTQRALPQIDSVLNQMPPLQNHPHYQPYGNPFAGAPEQLLQSPLGPTVSNDQGPFGPYWHDGTFIPYRPAALRDPRFYHHHEPNWTHPQHSAFMSHAYNNTIPNMQMQQHPYQLQQAQNPFVNVGKPAVNYASQFQQQHLNTALDYQNQALPVPPSHRPHIDFSLASDQSILSADQILTPTTITDFGTQSLNAQTRERVFAWAHTVYVDLLKFLQSTRKSSSQQHSGGQQHHARPHIYPKPPKQPAADFSSSSGSSGSNAPASGAPQIGKFDTSGQSQSARDVLYRPSHTRSSSAWSFSGVDPSMHRQSWYLSQPQSQQFANPNLVHGQVSGTDPVRPLRRMSGSIAGAHHNLRHELPPSMTAASALDAITKHCEESKWNWIDGILLGGCLAYALGDYQKAQEWYKHILKLDKE